MTSLGLLIRDSKKAVPPGYWWLVVYPGAFFILLSLCINFIGDGLRDAVDPHGTWQSDLSRRLGLTD